MKTCVLEQEHLFLVEGRTNRQTDPRSYIDAIRHVKILVFHPFLAPTGSRRVDLAIVLAILLAIFLVAARKESLRWILVPRRRFVVL